jgi:hypothetical protein
VPRYLLALLPITPRRLPQGSHAAEDDHISDQKRGADYDNQPIGVYYLRPCAPVTGSVHPVLVALDESPPATTDELGRHAPRARMCGGPLSAPRGLLPISRFPQPYAGASAVLRDELDAGCLERAADGGEGARVERFATLQPSNSVW